MSDGEKLASVSASPFPSILRKPLSKRSEAYDPENDDANDALEALPAVSLPSGEERVNPITCALRASAVRSVKGTEIRTLAGKGEVRVFLGLESNADDFPSIIVL